MAYLDEEMDNMIEKAFRARRTKLTWCSAVVVMCLFLGMVDLAKAEKNVRGMDPSIEATYFPLLGGFSHAFQVKS